MFSQTRTWDSNAMAQRLQARKRSREARKKADAVGLPAPGPRPEHQDAPVLEQRPPPIQELPDESDQEDSSIAPASPPPVAIDIPNRTGLTGAGASKKTPSRHQRAARKTARHNVGDRSRSTEADVFESGSRSGATERQLSHDRLRRAPLTPESHSSSVGRRRLLSAETGTRAGRRRRSHGLLDETDASNPTMKDGHSAALHSDAVSSTVQVGVACDWCDRDLSDQTRHHCSDCPFDLCSVCVFNKKVIFPEHGRGHKFEQLQPGSEPTGGTRSDTAAGRACTLCGVDISATWYECQQCEDVVLCEDDRKLHVADHPLRAVSTTPRRDVRPAARPPRHTRSPSRASEGRALGSTDRDMDSLGGSSAEDGGGDGESTAGSTLDEGSQGDESGEETGSPEDEEEAAPSSSRMSSLRPRPSPRPSPQHGSDHITLVLPREGYAVFATWARAILDQAPQEIATSSRSTRGRWSSKDRRKLERLKAQGKTDEEAGKVLGRTPGAVAQQWRKQKGH